MDRRLKIEHLGGHEHVERAVPGRELGGLPHETEAVLPEIFRWTLRTKIAA